jgi:hypothetical protein
MPLPGEIISLLDKNVWLFEICRQILPGIFQGGGSFSVIMVAIGLVVTQLKENSPRQFLNELGKPYRYYCSSQIWRQG